MWAFLVLLYKYFQYFPFPAHSRGTSTAPLRLGTARDLVSDTQVAYPLGSDGSHFLSLVIGKHKA